MPKLQVIEKRKRASWDFAKNVDNLGRTNLLTIYSAAKNIIPVAKVKIVVCSVADFAEPKNDTRSKIMVATMS